jgi:hypothetical protein
LHFSWHGAFSKLSFYTHFYSAFFRALFGALEIATGVLEKNPAKSIFSVDCMTKRNGEKKYSLAKTVLWMNT